MPTPGQLPERDHDRYRMLGEQGRGGLGRVLEAEDRVLGRRVALKEILARNPVSEARFVREARLTARLEHPAIVPVHDAGRWSSGEPFYTMKLVGGRSLKECLAEAQSLGERLLLLPNLLAVAEAVAYAHSKRVIHRDLKPSNIMVGDFGETQVIDWGLAKELDAPTDAVSDGGDAGHGDEAVTLAGSVLGTPAYMAPEQARGEPVDARADVYALGAILYELLSGKSPPPGGSSQAADPIDELEPRAPRALVTIANKAMRAEPAARYATASSLVHDLKLYLQRRLVSTSPTASAVAHERVYARPQLYELAFSYRDIEAECDFLLDVYQRARSCQAKSFLEIAAGTAVHGRCLARRNLSCFALDRSTEMVAYGKRKAAELGLALDYVAADMAAFTMKRRVDFAACMLDSLSYLLTNDAVRAHLDAVADALEEDGLYILEMTHPAQVFGRAEITKSRWEIEDEGGVLDATWAEVESTFDPTTQCSQVDAYLVYSRRDGTVEEIRDSSSQRVFTWNELEALVVGNGRFRIIDVYGDLKRVGFTADAWRMVPVLQKK